MVNNYEGNLYAVCDNCEQITAMVSEPFTCAAGHTHEGVRLPEGWWVNADRTKDPDTWQTACCAACKDVLANRQPLNFNIN